MFFEFNLLCRSGNTQLNLSWMAATRGVKCLKRRQIISADILTTW